MALGFTIVMRELKGVVWLSVGSMALWLNTASSDFFHVGSCKRLQNKIIYVLGGLEAYMPLRNTETQLRSFRVKSRRLSLSAQGFWHGV